MTNIEAKLMKINNMNYLKAHRMDLYNKILELEKLAKMEKLKIIREENLAADNLVLQIGQDSIYVHDNTDPWKEASEIIQSVEQQLNQPNHQVVFFGTGLGYHIKHFTTLFPQVPYSIYEPSAQTFLAFMSSFSFEEMNLNLLRNLFIGYDSTGINQEIKSIIYQMPSSFTILTLKSYQNAYRELYQQFITLTDRLVKFKQQQLQINHHFEKQWVRNSIDNFHYTLGTRSIFDYQTYFQNKPVILVAAGASLQDEIENIKKIKEQKSAYIITVGSAINSFIENKIVPDAAFTYDPKVDNHTVFDRAIQENKEAFPLVFGTTVGKDTVGRFPWSKIHIPLNQDSVYAFYSKKDLDSNVMQDAPSVAIIALQVLIALQCSSIILVGQNFAYRNGKYYSDGIANCPDSGPDEIEVESVSGETLLTTSTLNLMRKEMEHYIRKHPSVHIINATKEGAAIEGTIFKPLSEVMVEQLSPDSVDAFWFSRLQVKEIDTAFLLEKKTEMLRQYEALTILFSRLQQAMGAMMKNQQPEVFQRFDLLFKELQHNLFFRYFIQPMNRVNYEILFSKVVVVKMEIDPIKKAEMLLSLFGKFLYECYEDFMSLQSQFEKLNQTIDEIQWER